MQHPLQNSGTQQIDRLLADLIPENLKLDDRSIEEVIAFAGSLATHVRYWNADNEADGDWRAFWESDQTTIFAILAGNDIESIRIGYRSKELDYYAMKKQEDNGTPPAQGSSQDAIILLVSDRSFGIYAVAALIASICEKIPASHQLKKEIQNIISTMLREPIKQLIRFHKAVDQNAIDKYSAFIGESDCAAAWGLPDNASFECIDFVLPFEFIDALWKLFLVFYKTLTIILGKLKKAFQSSLRSRHDHAPHITLFITFLNLFHYLQDDLNDLTGKHLLFYYQDVLRLQRKRLIPDRVHLVFEIASKVVRHRIVKGTAFKAGADSAGKPMSYELEEELVISPVQLAEKKNLYLTAIPATNGGNQKLFAIALPAADKRDGIAEEWTPEAKAWNPLSGMAVYERLQYKFNKLTELRNRFDGKILPPAFIKEFGKLEALLKKLQAFSGFSIASTHLWSTTGLIRMASLVFNFNGVVNDNQLDKYIVQLSTKAGLVTLKPYFREIPADNIDPDTGLPEDVDLIEGLRGIRRDLIDPDPSLHNIIVRIEGTQRYLIILDPIFPSVLPVDGDSPPFVRFILKDQFDTSAEMLTSIEVQAFFIGNLSAFKKTPQGIFSRITTDGPQSADELVITDAGDQEVMVRIPELFMRKSGLALFTLNGPYSNLSVSVLSNDQWVDIGNDGTIPQMSFVEPGNTAALPAQFNFTPNAHNADGWFRLTFQIAAGTTPPQVLDDNDVAINYRSAPETIVIKDQPQSWSNVFSYYTSLGEWVADGTSQSAMHATPVVEQPQPEAPITSDYLETYDKGVKNPPPLSLANGNLFLGFANLVPDQTLSLLFQMAAGTENPDHFAPEVKWSYLRDDTWIGIPPQYILHDSTLGLKQTGIILFQVPRDINNGNTWITGADNRTDLYWLRASAQELPDEQVFVDALPMLKDIFVNAGEAMFTDDNNTEDHLDKGIPAGTISDLRFRDVAVKSVTQPFTSFDGRRSEKADLYGYLRRVHERLRHRNRAVTFWDYERITLQQFPKIAVAKCLPHTRKLNTAYPGYVTVVAIPFPKDMTGNRVYYPICSAGLLQQVKIFLVKQNSYFVGRYGDPEFCCCEDDCTCEHHGRLEVINARFEPVRLKICVRFYEGRDIPFYTKELNEALKQFLAPWAREDKPLLFGVKVSITRLLRFLENLDYVDVIMGLQVKQFSSRAMSENFEENVDWSNPEEIVPFTAASVITTYLDKLNEDNPNVIDHEINVIPSHEKCTCKGCVEKLPEPVDPNEPIITRLREDLRELWLQHAGNIASVIKNFVRMLDDLVANGTLQGATTPDPEKGEAGINAYRIEKDKRANRVRALEIGLSFDTTKPFTLFTVNNPNSNV